MLIITGNTHGHGDAGRTTRLPIRINTGKPHDALAVGRLCAVQTVGANALFDPNLGGNHGLTRHGVDQGKTQYQWQAFDAAAYVTHVVSGFAPVKAANDLGWPLMQRWVFQGYRLMVVHEAFSLP
ncbi:hypothetical protein EMIT0347P_100104 [Pseudomonas sp. IT-347P]